MFSAVYCFSKRRYILPGKVYIINKKERCPEGCVDVDTTSHSTSWTRGLSPFVLGPCDCSFENCRSWNVENAYQFARVHDIHDDDGQPNVEWYKWAMAGFANKKANRRPMGFIMGKAPKPLYAWYRGEKYGYIEGRKEIYIPLYAKSASKSNAYWHLKAMHEIGVDIALRDFDGYRIDALNMTLEDVVNSTATMGHAFVLAMMLNGMIHDYVDELKC